MKEWKEVKLGEISTNIAYGYTESAKNEPIGPKFLRITDISSGRLNWSKVPYCPISKENLEKYLLHSGDIVIARTGATTGATYTIKPKDPRDVVFASYLIRYQIDKTLAEPFFIDFVLRSYYWKGFVDGIKGGSAQPGANAKQFASFEFLLPPLPTQKQIAEILTSLDDKIDLLHRQNKTLEAMAETLFREWFVENVEEDWEEGKLEDLLEIKYGKDHKHLEVGKIPVYGSGGIMRYVNQSLYTEESILIPRKGTLSNLFYLNEPFWSVDTMFYSIIKKKEYGKYCFLLLKTKNLASMNVGSAVPSLTTKLLNSISVIIPPIDIMKRFDAIISDKFVKIKFNQTQIQTLEKLRDTLLPKLMSGAIKVVENE